MKKSGLLAAAMMAAVVIGGCQTAEEKPVYNFSTRFPNASEAYGVQYGDTLYFISLYNSFYRVRRYLNQRGIGDDVLDYCVQLGILYESAPYHNAVFVGMDERGEARYAFLRGIYDNQGKSFRMEQEGSEKLYSFCVPPLGKSCRVVVYEACIDALAHMTLEGNADKYRLSLGGVAAPKEGTGQNVRKMKIPDAL